MFPGLQIVGQVGIFEHAFRGPKIVIGAASQEIRGPQDRAES